MEIKVQRDPSKDETTFGKLTTDAGFACETLEDQIREVPMLPGEMPEQWVMRWKIKAQTAIPAGRYRVFMQPSPKFKGRQMPHLQGVPGFYFIMIHPLNIATQTEGCLGVGLDRVEAERSPFRSGDKPVPGLLRSQAAFEPLEQQIIYALAQGDAVWIEIVNPPEVAK